MRIVAIIAVYNEQRFIAACIEHLRAQGVETYVIDNQSSDATREIATGYRGHGVCGIETMPRDGVYRWRALLRRKEALAGELDADWFLHLDADEIPLPPRPDTTLAAELAAADEAGYNAVEFAEFTFVPTRESPDHDHAEYRRTMIWYYPFAPNPLHLLRAWKRQPGPVDLVTYSGHRVEFAGRRILPRRLWLRHYLFLSSEHALRKYVRKRYDAAEVGDAWHGWRATLRADAVRLPSQAQLRLARTDAELDPASPRTLHCLEWEVEPSAAGAANAVPDAPAMTDEWDGHPRVVDRPPTVLCVVDRPDWAHDRKTQSLERELAGRFRIIKRYQSELSAADLGSADLVLFYYWQQVERLGALAGILRRRGDRVLLGISSHFELEGAWRGRGLELLASLPRAVFANNRSLIEEFQPILGRLVAYTPNGVDTEFFRPPPRRPAGKRLRVGWAGSLKNQGSEHRGVREIIEPAVAAVGRAELRLAVREERWRGREEMLGFYYSIDVYVCASRSEGTPNPCLEAAACGVPVITTRVGNMPELICNGENGFFIQRDVADLAEKLRWLAADRRLRAEMGRNARRSVEPWAWRVQAARYAELFGEALGARPSRRPAG